jgi:hypothetical protein
MERETGIEPATNSLEGCDSTTELLPPSPIARFARGFGAASSAFVVHPGGFAPADPLTRSLAPSTWLRAPRAFRRGAGTPRSPLRSRGAVASLRRSAIRCRARSAMFPLNASETRPATSEPPCGESSGGEGRIRTFEAARATDLQSAAFDRFATSPAAVLWKRDVFLNAFRSMELAKGFEPPTC